MTYFVTARKVIHGKKKQVLFKSVKIFARNEQSAIDQAFVKHDMRHATATPFRKHHVIHDWK